MHDAFKTWDRGDEPLESTEMRIHDGVAREELRARGRRYLARLRDYFPWSIPERGKVVMEIGSGMGYPMEAALEAFDPRCLIGLDVARSMIAKAKTRFVRDGVRNSGLSFLLYDGVTIPLRDQSVDFVYSVAALQHVPKVYVYNLLFDILRVLSPSGWCAIHLLSFGTIRQSWFSFANEVAQQLAGKEGHWHHFYAFDELLHVLDAGIGARQIEIIEDEQATIWVCFTRNGDTFRRRDLPAETHANRIR